MARVEPLRALHYDPAVAGPLQHLAAPPYDVIDPAQRAELAARAPHNVVEIDLPEDPDGGDRYAHAAALLSAWRAEGAVVQDDEPALWAIVQDYTGPDGRTLTRNGFFARVRVEEYGPGTIRPHERTHPGPKEDRLRLTRATQANLSPIFSPVLRSRADRLERAEAGHRERPSRSARSTRPTARATASGGSPIRGHDRDGHRGDGRRRAAHRRRPSPLRDRARLRRRDRRRGRPPLRAHVPRRAAGRGPHGLPHAPPRVRAERQQREDRGVHRHAARELRHRHPRSTPTTSSRPARATARSSSATWTATSSARSA